MYFLSSYLFKFIANGSDFGMLMWRICENQGYVDLLGWFSLSRAGMCGCSAWAGTVSHMGGRLVHPRL